MYKKECFVCGSQESKGKLHKHHIDFHHNNDTPDNIVILCERCHAAIHQKTGYASRDELLKLRQKILAHKNAT